MSAIKPIPVGVRPPLLRQSAGGRHVQTGEHRQGPIIIARLFFLDRNDRHIQRAADHFDDLAHGYALFANGVVDPVYRALLQRKPV